MPTRLNWNADGGFAGAIERCNGVGACRKLNAGAMCPSYMATREEEHSTRGRANALRAAISSAIPINQLTSQRMHDVLDLCLECKSCKSECPSNVDMAKIKYEFLNLYNAEHGIPLRSRLVANIHTLSALAAGPQAGMANFAMRNSRKPLARRETDQGRPTTQTPKGGRADLRIPASPDATRTLPAAEATSSSSTTHS